VNGNTVQDLINAAYRSFGYLGRGTALTAADSFDAFEALNNLIDRSNSDRLMIYEISRNVFPLSAGVQVYTLGTGGAFSMPRPPKINNMSVLLTANNPPQEIPIEVMDEIKWQDVTLKTGLNAQFPLACYPDNNFPLNNLSFWPTPSGTCSAVIYAWSLLSAFTTLGQTVSFPPTYKDFLMYGTAIRMAAEKGFECSQTVHNLFAKAEGMIRNVNWREGKVEIDPVLYGRFNIMRAIKSQGAVVD
jgi:hypothetical protein